MTYTYKPNLRRIEGLAKHLLKLRHEPEEDIVVFDRGLHVDLEASSELNKNRFYMGSWEFACKAPACMAGWAVFKYGDVGARRSGISTEASRLLGLDDNWSDKLFVPNLTCTLTEVTPKQASAALMRVAKQIRAGKDWRDMTPAQIWGRKLTE